MEDQKIYKPATEGSECFECGVGKFKIRENESHGKFLGCDRYPKCSGTAWLNKRPTEKILESLKPN